MFFRKKICFVRAFEKLEFFLLSRQIIRSDIIQDLGKSLSPEVDIGQVEGAYIMGMGFWLKERLVYDENTGELLTKNTWVIEITVKGKKICHLVR